jgi:hypothetical protein
VVEKLTDSALLLGNAREAAYYEQRYQAAFAKDYARWKPASGSGPGDKAP